MNKNYIPLYRKYRPQTIEQIVGQEHIKKALANSIKMNRISHAYLFTGPRGTGKTSSARIFAKSLNCIKGPTISPCNECENCKNITNSIPIDVIEIDAASNRSVNDADEIIQKVALAPVSSRYKIYIIDEVHMLTPQAFNALLKTLEEPPENVIFILATTEVHKVLDTIKSRCQRFDFKRITTEDIVKHLRYISDCEKINITDDALNYIAQNSAGGMRDSIALLDQLSVLNSDTPIDVEDINKLLGRISFKDLNELFNYISDSNQIGAIEKLNTIYNQGNEPSQILSNLLEFMRNALIVKSVGAEKSKEIIQLNPELLKVTEQSVSKLETHQITALIDKCANYTKELKLTSNPKMWLDVSILDMSNLTQNTKLDELQKRISLLESGTAVKISSAYNTPPAPIMKQEIKKAQVTSNNAKTEPKEQTQIIETEEPAPEQNSAISSTEDINTLWTKFLDNISSFPSRAILKQQALPVQFNTKEVIISIKNPNWLKSFGTDGDRHEFIVESVKKLFGGETPKIIVRAPQQGDDTLRKTSDNNIKNDTKQNESDENPEPEPRAKIEASEISESAKEEPDSEEVESAIEQKKETVSSDSSFHSDGVNMVIDLFEGKLIE